MRTKQKHKIKKLGDAEYNVYITTISGDKNITEPQNKEDR